MAMSQQRALLVARFLARRQMLKAFGANARMLSTSCGRFGAVQVPGGGEYQPHPVACDIGNREVVGFGLNGVEMYADTLQAPFPAIRFKEETAEVAKIRQKEQGDWKKMTKEEKKALYRHSFCQTIAEYKEPTSDWKKVVGIALVFISFGIWGVVWLKMYVYPPLPTTLTDEEWRKNQIKRMIDMRINPIDGFSSKYDYDNNKWKDQ